MKGSRHEMILSLISSEQIGTLEELMVKLQEQGVYVSQSSLSHDIRDLKITKVRASDGRLMFVKPEDADEITAKQKQEKEIKQQQSSKYSDVIPDNIPENIQKRLVTLFEKLDEAYPNKVITGLQKDHKNWAETVTDLYRKLGYSSGNAFLEAFGYTVEQGKGGRPTGDIMAPIRVLKERYKDGATCSSVKELFEDNPDIAPKCKNIQNKAMQLFGMSFSDYLKQEKILQGEIVENNAKHMREQVDEIITVLQSKYIDSLRKPTSYKELVSENPEIRFDEFSSMIRVAYRMKTEDFLYDKGIIKPFVYWNDDDKQVEFERIKSFLKSNHQTKPVESYAVLKKMYSDINWQIVEALAIDLHGKTATFIFTKEGILEDQALVAPPPRPKIYNCIPPFIPVNGQGYNEDSIVYDDIITSYFEELYRELFYYRAFVTMIIDSDHERKVELLASLFSHDFAYDYSEALGKRKYPKGFKDAVPENERYIWFSHFLRIALLIVMSNDVMFKHCADQCLGNTSAFIEKDKQEYKIPASFSLDRITKALTSYMDLIPGSDDIFKKVFFEGKVEPNQLANELIELALVRYSTDDIVQYFCNTFHITAPQFQIRQFGAKNIASPDDRFALLKNPYGEITIFNYRGQDTNVDIPDQIQGSPVTAIFSHAFSTEPSSYTGGDNEMPLSYRLSTRYNGHNAFIYNCRRIEHLHIPESVNEIGEDAFWGGLPKLKELAIPSQVSNIPSIRNFKALTKLRLPDKAYYLGGTHGIGSINNCPEVEYIRIPEGLSENSVFRIDSCKKLKYIEMPESLQRIHGIRNCPSLHDLYLPVDRFEQLAFEGCTGLKNVYFSNLKYAFQNGFDLNNTPDLVLHGYKKSYTEKYAKRIGVAFVPDCTPETKQKLDEQYKEN